MRTDDDPIDFMIRLYRDLRPEVTDAEARRIERQLRQLFGGRRVYVAKAPRPAALQKPEPP